MAVSTDYNERIAAYESEFGVAYVPGYKIVLTLHGNTFCAVLGHVGDYAVYHSSVPALTVDEVAMFGSKCSEDEARTLFSFLNMLKYRR